MGLTTAQNVQGRAHNALAAALTEFMPLSDRERVSAAVVAAVEPVIRADERRRFLEAARDFPEPFRAIIAEVAAGEH